MQMQLQGATAVKNRLMNVTAYEHDTCANDALLGVSSGSKLFAYNTFKSCDWRAKR